MATLEGSPDLQELRDAVLTYPDLDALGASDAPKTLEEVLAQIETNPVRAGQRLFAVAYENQRQNERLESRITEMEVTITELESTARSEERRATRYKREAGLLADQVALQKEFIQQQKELLQHRSIPGHRARSTSRSSPTRERTPGTTASSAGGKGKRSAKFPDPPILEDGVKPTFRVWNDQMKSKLQINDDWFNQEDPERVEHAKVAYIKTRVDGKAAEHLYPWLEAQEATGTPIYVETVIQCLENVFEDPDRRLKARAQLKKLRMTYLSDFNTFQSEFLRLANSAKMPTNQWKEELHDKLYDQLQVQMEVYVADDEISFDGYCNKAQQFARGLTRAGERERARKDQLQKKRSVPRFERKATVAAETQETTKPTTKPVTPVVKCYACDKVGHYAKDCTQKPKAEAKGIDSEHSDHSDYASYAEHSDSGSGNGLL